MLEVTLRNRLRGMRRVRLRDLSGHDELSIEGTGVTAATGLIDRLIVAGPDDGERPASSLTLTERDQILAALYVHCFGDRVESVVRCSACDEPSSLDFSLTELLDDLFARPDEAGVFGPDDSGVYTLGDGRRFRLPTAADESAAAELPADRAAEYIVERCVAEFVTQTEAVRDLAPLERALEQVAPLLDLRMAIQCAGCGAAVEAEFDVVRFFLAALARERALLFREVHRLAATYHWSLHDILQLPRNQRRAHVALAEAEHQVARRTA